jgi:hypothetical protein
MLRVQAFVVGRYLLGRRELRAECIENQTSRRTAPRLLAAQCTEVQAVKTPLFTLRRPAFARSRFAAAEWQCARWYHRPSHTFPPPRHRQL